MVMLKKKVREFYTLKTGCVINSDEVTPSYGKFLEELIIKVGGFDLLSKKDEK